MFNNLIDMPWYSQVDRGTYWLYNIILLSLLLTTQVKCSRVTIKRENNCESEKSSRTYTTSDLN